MIGLTQTCKKNNGRLDKTLLTIIKANGKFHINKTHKLTTPNKHSKLKLHLAVISTSNRQGKEDHIKEATSRSLKRLYPRQWLLPLNLNRVKTKSTCSLTTLGNSNLRRSKVGPKKVLSSTIVIFKRTQTSIE